MVTGTASKQPLQTRNLTLQGEDRLLELHHFLARPTLSEFCHLVRKDKRFLMPRCSSTSNTRACVARGTTPSNHVSLSFPIPEVAREIGKLFFNDALAVIRLHAHKRSRPPGPSAHVC